MSQNPIKHRPRISLLTLMLGVTVLCLGVSHWNTSKRLATSEKELRRLLDESGYLHVEDASKFHAVAVESEEANTWRWRLFIPKGVRYKWNIACEAMPANSPPSTPGATGASNEPYWETETEVVVTARLRQMNDGDWNLSVVSKIGDSKNQMAGAELRIPKEKIAWLTTISSTDGRVIGTNGTETLDPAGPIILLQRRPCEKQPNGTYQPSQNAMPGFMLWLTKF